MTLLAIQERDSLWIGCDSAGIMKQDGKLYRINGEQQKLFPLDNKVVYCDGNGFLTSRLMDIFINKTDRTIGELQALASLFFREYNQKYPDEYGPNFNYVLHEIIVAMAEDDGTILCMLTPENDFQPNIQIVDYNDYSVYGSGYRGTELAEMAASMYREDKAKNHIFEESFSSHAFDSMGVCLTAFEVISGYSPSKFLEIDILPSKGRGVRHVNHIR